MYRESFLMKFLFILDTIFFENHSKGGKSIIKKLITPNGLQTCILFKEMRILNILKLFEY